jgi:hypothetical protein
MLKFNLKQRTATAKETAKETIKDRGKDRLDVLGAGTEESEPRTGGCEDQGLEWAQRA